MAGTLSIQETRLRWHRMANISHIPKFIVDKLGISVGFCPYLQMQNDEPRHRARPGRTVTCCHMSLFLFNVV